MIQDQVLQTSRRLRQAPRVVKQCIGIMSGALLLLEVPTFLHWLWPTFFERTRNWFLRPGFRLKYDWQLCWYLKGIVDDIFVLALIYVAAKYAKHYSEIGFLFFAVLLGYMILDFFMFFWDHNSTHAIYIDMICTFFLFVYEILKGYQPETIARVRSLF